MIQSVSEFMETMSPIRWDVDPIVEQQVEAMICAVRTEKDAAVRRLTLQFDGVDLKDLEVPRAVWEKAWTDLPDHEKAILTTAADRITRFHVKQRPQSWSDYLPDGSILGQIHQPLDRVGVYVPGGRAPYPSSVLMNVLPAVIAGVPEIILATPPRDNGKCDPRVLAAAYLCGVHRVFAMGGVQAVAAMAYGTETVPRVDKITGPGNQYVTMAKKRVYGQVDIDMLAGPSEIMIVADDTAPVEWVAADLLSQAEHDPQAGVVLVSTSADLLQSVKEAVSHQLDDLPRKDTAAAAMENSRWVMALNLDEAMDAVNHFAPEHMEIMTRDAMSLVGRIRHAGSIFVGSWSPEPTGDYTAGPNHVLPTGGTARFYSALGVAAFMKTSNVTALTEKGFQAIADSTAQFARWEDFQAHERSITIRRKTP